MSGCVQGASPGQTALPSQTALPDPTSTSTGAGKLDIPPNTDPPSPEILGPVPSGFDSWTEVFALQQRMNTAANLISAAAGAGAGLAGIIAAPENRRLKVYWKGRQPPETMRLIDDIRTSLPVEVLPARYAAAELSRVSRSVATRAGVVAVGGNVDGSGITATVDADIRYTDWGVDVPVTVERGEQPFLVACSRQADCAPWFGGSTYLPSSGGVCNLGFTVWKPSSDGQAVDDYMLSAGHCADLGDVATTPSGAFVGDVVADDDDRDTLLIKHHLRYSFDGRIYTGTWNAISGYNRRVLGTFGNFVGAYVCTSGSYTGEHCGLKVDKVDEWISADGTVLGAFVRATHPTGGVAVGTGDSGGPVHVPVGEAVTYAMGTMTAGQSVVACPAGVPSTKCGSSVYYADISGSLNYYQAKIATGAGFVWPSYSPP